MQELNGVRDKISKKNKFEEDILLRLIVVWLQRMTKMDREWWKLLISPADRNKDT